MKITKRNGQEVDFNKTKIENAIYKANKEVNGEDKLSHKDIIEIADLIEKKCNNFSHVPSVEDVQDLVEQTIMEYGKYKLAQKYIKYRYNHETRREISKTDENILALVDGVNEEMKQENSNKNPIIASTQRDYMAGEVSKDISRRFLLPEDVVAAHDDGRIHFHDMDYFAQRIYNCCLINLEDMLQNGTVISETMIEKPHSFRTACNVATQIIAQVASNQYGGQSITLTHLAPFIDISRQKNIERITKQYQKIHPDDWEMYMEEIKFQAEELTLDEVRDGVQTIQYQVTTLQTTNGQAPFITVFMYLNEIPDTPENEQLRKDLVTLIDAMLDQRIKGVKNEKGVYITPAFPKLIYVLQEDNIRKGSKYYALTEKAAACTAKRLVPDYISEKVMKNLKGHVFPPMGCRSLTSEIDKEKAKNMGNVANAGNYKEGESKFYGRFNQGVVTINLPDAALASGGNKEIFWDILENTLEICHKALQVRHNRLRGTLSDVAPILWQHGAIARLQPGESIDKLLFNGYSTISLGYAGLYEMTKYMTGHSHTEPEGKEFALQVMQKLNDKCNEWKAAENIGYAVYGTPLESTTYKFAKALQKKYGIIEGITDKNYITNSYHVNVREEIDAFTKLGFESEFQQLSQGGAISYVETPDMQNNIPAVLSVMEYIYDNIMYAELNTKSDYCMECGYDGEIQIVEEEESGKLIWECPCCKNRDENKMSVARRTCGYIGTQFWNQGRTQEIRDRVLHL